MDLKKILEQVREERDIREREAQLAKKAPHPTNTFRIGSPGWLKAKRAAIRKEKELEDKELEAKIAKAQYNARHYRKNKKRLNAARVKRMRWPKPTYERAKARALRRGQEWDMTFEEWKEVWDSAPRCWNPEKAFWDTAWNMRGGNHTTDCQMVRLDTEKGWTKENVRINVPPSGSKHEP